MIMSRRKRWAGHIVCMGRRGMLIGHWRESQKNRDQEDQGVGGWIILKWFLER
jgi:hypothetical protein